MGDPYNAFDVAENAAAQADAQLYPPWECKYCKNLNPGSAAGSRVCAYCSWTPEAAPAQPTPSAPPPPPDWKCATCTRVNPGSERVCGRCSKSDPWRLAAEEAYAAAAKANAAAAEQRDNYERWGTPAPPAPPRPPDRGLFKL